MENETQHQGAGIMDYLKAVPQYFLPHHLLSNIMFSLTRSKVAWWKNTFIKWFVKQYDVDMSEAVQQDPTSFDCFNDFFTRSLLPDARPLCTGENTVACPVDGYVSQAGNIEKGRIFQAKGQAYTVEELLAGDKENIQHFEGGSFATLYLSPKNYHRIHMPVGGTLTQMSYVPGRLFSVNPATARTIPRLFARNERVITYFETAAGPMAMVLVGAIFVGSMETVWHGVVTPPHGQNLQHWNYANITPQERKKGDEMGRFNMGSTVILLFPKNTIEWEQLEPGKPIVMGQQIAKYQ